MLTYSRHRTCPHKSSKPAFSDAGITTHQNAKKIRAMNLD
jgi:hypothetical protein